MRQSLPSLAVLVALAAAVPAAPAQAQRRSGEQRGRSTEKAARKHYERGRAHHERREYELALREYERAYDLEPTPALLFNIAQVYLLSGNPEKALEHYHQYVVLEPEGEVSDLARQRIAEIERELGQAAPEGLEAPEGAGEAPAKDEPAASPPEVIERPVERAPQAPGSPGRGMRVAGLATVGLGLVGVGLGVKLGLDASRIQDEIEGQPAGEPWTFDDLYAEGEAASRNMWISYGVGAAAVITGGVLYYLGRSAGRAEERRWAIAPVWGTSGSGLVLVGGF
jgi:tetratricopeptide (TPR) repeat protein